MVSQDVLNGVFAVLAVPLASVAAAVLWKLQAKLGLQATAADRSNMEHELQVAIGAGMAEVAKSAPVVLSHGIVNEQIMADVSEAAARFLKDRYPDRAAQIGGSSDLPAHVAVQQSIAARLTNVNPVTTLLPGPGPGLGGASMLPATTLPGALTNAAPPP